MVISQTVHQHLLTYSDSPAGEHYIGQHHSLKVQDNPKTAPYFKKADEFKFTLCARAETKINLVGVPSEWSYLPTDLISLSFFSLFFCLKRMCGTGDIMPHPVAWRGHCLWLLTRSPPYNLLFAFQTLCMSHVLAISLKSRFFLTNFIYTINFIFYRHCNHQNKWVFSTRSCITRRVRLGPNTILLVCRSLLDQIYWWNVRKDNIFHSTEICTKNNPHRVI